jgi:D-methionine transport system substrate-binding protein
MKKLLSSLFAISVVLVLGVSLSSCGEANTDKSASAPEKGTQSNPVKIGVVGASDPQWTAFEKAAKAAGIYVEIKDFNDYEAPNLAVEEGSLDINEYQHIIYLANWDKKHDANIVPVGSTAVYPMSLYGDVAKGINSISDIKEGDTIVIPQDPTNGGRALLLLQSLDLVKLKNGGTAFSTDADVIAGESKVKIKQVENSLAPTLLTDPTVAAAIVNNDFVTQLSPENLANILSRGLSDDPKAIEPYINIFATKESNKDNAVFAKLVDIFHNDADVQAALVKSAGGSDKIKLTEEYTADDLVKVLDHLKDGAK